MSSQLKLDFETATRLSRYAQANRRRIENGGSLPKSEARTALPPVPMAYLLIDAVQSGAIIRESIPAEFGIKRATVNRLFSGEKVVFRKEINLSILDSIIKACEPIINPD